jgi:hypothetical protein
VHDVEWHKVRNQTPKLQYDDLTNLLSLLILFRDINFILIILDFITWQGLFKIINS